MSEAADRATNFSDCDSFARFHEPLAIATHLVEPNREEPKRECHSKGSGLGVDSMRATDLRSIFEFMRTSLQHGQQRIDFLEQQIARVAQPQRIRRVNDV